MNIIQPWKFVIETYLPIDKGEDLGKVTIEEDQSIKDVRYAYHWFCGISLMPGTGIVNKKTGQPVMPVWVNVWSPYFVDVKEFYDDREKAEEVLTHAVGKDHTGYRICTIEQSNYLKSWKYE